MITCPSTSVTCLVPSQGRPQGKSSATEDEVIMTGHKTVQENASLTLTSTAPPNGTIWEAEAACIGVSIYFDLC